jgi:hypothetical protein
MKRISTALLAAFLLALVVVGLVGLLAKGDHRTDRNVPGATTGPGRASLTDAN